MHEAPPVVLAGAAPRRPGGAWCRREKRIVPARELVRGTVRHAGGAPCERCRKRLFNETRQDGSGSAPLVPPAGQAIGHGFASHEGQARSPTSTPLTVGATRSALQAGHRGGGQKTRSTATLRETPSRSSASSKRSSAAKRFSWKASRAVILRLLQRVTYGGSEPEALATRAAANRRASERGGSRPRRSSHRNRRTTPPAAPAASVDGVSLHLEVLSDDVTQAFERLPNLRFERLAHVIGGRQIRANVIERLREFFRQL